MWSLHSIVNNDGAVGHNIAAISGQQEGKSLRTGNVVACFDGDITV